MRTDNNNNPTAFTTAVAKNAGLVEGTDYKQGDPFPVDDGEFYTAKLLGDPINLTIQVIDKLGFITLYGNPRWEYIKWPHFVWNGMAQSQKIDVIGWMYQHEGGETMRSLFPNYGRI